MSYSIPLPVNKSRWAYQTASGGGLTVGMVAGSGGSIILRSPQGENVSYCYGGVGVGAGVGARLPRFGKVSIQIKGKASRLRERRNLSTAMAESLSATP